MILFQVHNDNLLFLGFSHYLDIFCLSTYVGLVQSSELLDLILEEGNQEHELRNEEKRTQRSRGNTMTSNNDDEHDKEKESA